MTDLADKIYEATGLTLNAEAVEAIGRMITQGRRDALEEAAQVADGYHQRAITWAKTVRGLDKHIDETDSSRIAAAIRALKGTV
jgi:hypothetical protein